MQRCRDAHHPGTYFVHEYRSHVGKGSHIAFDLPQDRHLQCLGVLVIKSTASEVCGMFGMMTFHDPSSIFVSTYSVCSLTGTSSTIKVGREDIHSHMV